MPIQVGIIGAGVGGLSAAIALRRTRRAKVELFEKSEFRSEIGAAISITPNGQRVLDDWGFDSIKARGVEAKQLRLVNPDSFEPLYAESFGDIQAEFGHKFRFYHRVDLHTTLREMAESPDGQPGDPAVIKLGNTVVDVNCDKGIITLEDGTKVQKDLIIIADGAKSKFQSTITGKEETLTQNVQSAFRCLIPMKDVLAIDGLRQVWDNQPAGYWVPLDLPRKFYLVTYPCRDEEVLNLAIMHQTLPKNEKNDDWNATAPTEDVLSLVDGFNPLLSDLIKKSADISVHKVPSRDPLCCYTRGRAVIIGDAAHAFSPTHAQGAVLALEEARVLEVLFSTIQDAAQVGGLLETYEKLTNRHLTVTHLLSNATPGLPGDPHRKRADELWGEGLFPFTAMNFTEPIRKFFYKRDMAAEAQEFLKKA